MSTSECASRAPLQLRAFFDGIPAVAWCCGPDGFPEFVNNRFHEYSGLSSDQTHENWKSTLHPDDVEVFEKWWQGLVQAPKTAETEIRFRRADGEYRWFQISAAPAYDEHGNVVRWYGINVEIHDRKDAEQKLQQDERELRTITDAIRQTVVVLAPDGATLYANRAALDITGLTPDEVKEQGFFQRAFHPDDVDRFQSERQKGLSQGAAFELEMRSMTADGQYRWRLVQYDPLKDEWGKVIRWYVTSTDIDALKRAKQALQRTQFYLSEGQRLAHMGSWAFNAAGFDYWSSELFQIHGLDPGGKPPTVEEYLDLVHPEDREFMQQGIRKMLADHLGFDVTKRIVRPDGKIRHVRCVGMPAADGATFQGFVGTGMDVTEQEQLMQKLRQSEQDLRTITDAIRQAIVVLAPDGTTIYANRVALDLTGLRTEEVNDKGFFEQACHPDDVERLQAERQKGLLRGAPFELEVRALFKRGQYRWQLTQYNPLKDERGCIIRWYVTATDIDDQKRTEERLRNENLVLREEIDRTSMFEEIVGSSKPMRHLVKQVEKVAPSDSTVLILGETGTGKELVARALHRRSKRANRAFVRVNCAAIPPSLIASELFGHEKGAFTGALQRRSGRFEAADGGTLFLDEIGELPMETQIALLRVLQEREFERVGSNHPIKVDVRLIAATNRDLPAAVAAGTFREDLFYRLNVFPISVPALRDRAEDIPLLVEYFVGRFAKGTGKYINKIAKPTLERLQAYHWPGNIRELQNVVERAVILGETETFEVDESWLKRETQSTPRSHEGLASLGDREIEMIESALAESHGRIAGPSGAAAKLGIPRQTLESKIRRLGIDKYGQKRPTSQ